MNLITDQAVQDFLAAQGIDAEPPHEFKNKAKAGAIAGLVGALFPVVGIVGAVSYRNTQEQRKQSWQQWKQYALTHAEWPAFWATHPDNA